MSLTKKMLEKKYNVILQYDDFGDGDAGGNRLTWRAYSLDKNNQLTDGIGYEVGGGYSLKEVEEELNISKSKGLLSV